MAGRQTCCGALHLHNGEAGSSARLAEETIGIALEDGSQLAYAYDCLDRLTGERRSAGSNTVFDVAYAYDDVGNRTAKSRVGVDVTSSYPYGTNGNRLAGWTASAGASRSRACLPRPPSPARRR